MSEPFEPRPEEKGALAPPSRRPPTAVGVSTPPPPPPHRHRQQRRSVRAVFRPLYVFTATCIGGGTALFFLAPWLLLRVTGVTLAVIGLSFCSLVLWVRFRGAGAWSSRREYQPIRNDR